MTVGSQPSGEPLQGRPGRRARWAQLLLIFTLTGMVSVAPTLLQHLAEDVPLPIDRLVSEFIGWYLWLPFVVAMFWLVRRFPLERARWKSRIAIYFASGIAASALYAVLALLKDSALNTLVWDRPAPSLSVLGAGFLFGGLEFYMLVFCTMLAVVHAFEYHQRYQDRSFKTARLEAQLSRAQLQVLRVQLNPHFLFNSLNAVSSLMHKDVDAADRMLVRLSDFLRLSLEVGDQQEVTLSDEVEILEHYVEIERARFGDRLEVTVDVDPDLLDAMVPNLVLQPLVENAIRHGLSMRSAPGHVEVRARPQFPDKIELRVSDNGPGIQGDPGEVLKPGVGLHNTMQRLQQLYGAAQRFEIGNARDGGFQVTLTFPLRREDAASDAAAWATAEPASERWQPRAAG